MHDAKTPTDDEGTAKQRLDLLGRGIGGHVKVFGAQADQQIPHRPAHHISRKTGMLQGANHVHRTFIDKGDVDLVLRRTYVVALAERRFFDLASGCAGGRVGFAEELIDEFFNHEGKEKGRKSQKFGD